MAISGHALDERMRPCAVVRHPGIVLSRVAHLHSHGHCWHFARQPGADEGSHGVFDPMDHRGLSVSRGFHCIHSLVAVLFLTRTDMPEETTGRNIKRRGFLCSVAVMAYTICSGLCV